MKLSKNQAQLRHIQRVCKVIHSHETNLTLQWISEHKKISDNEEADIAAENVYKLLISLKA